MKVEDIINSALYPNPVLLVSAEYESKETIVTLSWGGTCCSDPPIVSIAIRNSRYSHNLIKQSNEFVVNIPTAEMLEQVKICGTKSGADIDKWAVCEFTKKKSKEVNAPGIDECPVNIECKVETIIELGTHDMFLGKVVALHIDEEWKGKSYPNLLTYARGKYKKCIPID